MFFLITTPSCPNCPRAKKLIEGRGLNVENVDASTPSGLDFAKRYSVMQVPTLLEVDDNEELVGSHMGIDAIANKLN